MTRPGHFTDEMINGDFKSFRHEHHFKSTPEGVEMTDVVKWRVPFGIFGDAMNWILIRKKVEGIFKLRKNRLGKCF